MEREDAAVVEEGIDGYTERAKLWSSPGNGPPMRGQYGRGGGSHRPPTQRMLCDKSE